MVKIIYLITDLELGGSPLVLRDRVRALRDLGEFSPTVVSLAPPGPVGKMIESDGIEVTGLGARSVADFPFVLKRWVRLVRQMRPAVIQSMLIHANALAVAGKCCTPPAVYVQELHTTQLRPRWHWWLQGRLAKRCDALIAPSQAVLDKLAHYGSVERGIVISNGVNVSRFRDATPIAPEQRPWPARARVIGYVGRFDPVKNLDLLLDAVEVLHRTNGPAYNMHLALVGYGEEENRLRQQAEKLGIASIVYFCGPTTTPEQWYKAFDILCLPSFSEGFGMTIIEAMAAGTPVLVASTPATREVIRDNIDGTLFSVPAKESLVSAIQSFINDKAGVTSRAKTAHERVQSDFSIERAAAEQSKILKKFLKM